MGSKMEKLSNPKNITGLSEKEAAEILKKQGYNELPSQKNQSLFSILLNVLKEPMLILLLGAGLIYLFLGEVKDALDTTNVCFCGRGHNI